MTRKENPPQAAAAGAATRTTTRRSLGDWLLRSGIERFELIPQRTELPERFAGLPFEVDSESLSTKGFYVIVYAGS